MSTLYPDLALTQYPENLDTFTTWLNITSTDGPLIAQYQAAMEAGNTVLANQILTQIPSGTQKIIKATDLNQLTQAMLAVERFYKTDIEPYIQAQQESWLNIINQFSYQGIWSSGTAYLQNNIVLYNTNGLELLFLAITTPPLGTPPTNATYWRVLTIQGQQGISGSGLTYMQEWVSSTTYNTNDAVTYSGGLWMALQPNTNVQPGTNEEFWKLVIPIITTTYPIQSTQPITQNQGDLWFNTQNNPTQYYYLEELDNPATSNEIVEGYEAYNDLGQQIIGTAQYLPISGGTMQGPVNMNNNAINNLSTPNVSTDAATKGYVDTVASGYLKLSGGTMTGTVSMNNNKITNIPSPINNGDAVNKQYVDTNIQTVNNNINSLLLNYSKIIIGSYTGNGGSSSLYPTVINVGVPIKAIYIIPNFPADQNSKEVITSIWINNSNYGRVLWGGFNTGQVYNVNITWTATGISFYHPNYAEIQLNDLSKSYSYIAFV